MNIEAAGPSTISLLGNETPVAECQELCCSTSQSCPYQPHDAHFLHSLTRAGATGLADPATAGPKLQKPTIKIFSLFIRYTDSFS